MPNGSEEYAAPSLNTLCWDCQAIASNACDHPGCAQRMCWDYTIVHAQPGDHEGWDGVDLVCMSYGEVDGKIRILAPREAA
jgi:hypothetical protein